MSNIDYSINEFEIADDAVIAERIKEKRFGNLFLENSALPPIGIFDLDEVLVNIGIKWISRFVKEGFLPTSTPPEEILKLALQHPEYYFWRRIGLDEEKTSIYQDCEDYYDELEPTNLGKNINSLAKTGRIRAVIITHCVNGCVNESKKRFCRKYFPDVLVVYTPLHIPKSEVINKLKLNAYSTFTDDSVKVLMDVARNTFSFGKELLVPKMGHNGVEKFSEEDKTFLVENGITLTHYENVL